MSQNTQIGTGAQVESSKQGKSEKIVFLGCGYVATPCALALAGSGYDVIATRRADLSLSPSQLEDARTTLSFIGSDTGLIGGDLQAKSLKRISSLIDFQKLLMGEDVCSQSADATQRQLAELLEGANYLVVSIAPRGAGDLSELVSSAVELLRRQEKESQFTIIYLSSIGVYGDHQGAWIDESADLRGATNSACRRIADEKRWTKLAARLGNPFWRLRLGGIYGPGERSPLRQIAQGSRKSIDKSGQVFNRTHVADIVRVILNIVGNHRTEGGIVNVVDGQPASQIDYLNFGAKLMEVDRPKVVPFEQADLSAMARQFWSANRRVSAKRLRSLFGELLFKNYRQGLESLRGELESIREQR